MSAVPESLFFYEQAPEPENTTEQVITGLQSEVRTISPKFFYDETGSRLFTEITRQGSAKAKGLASSGAERTRPVAG